MIPAIPPDRGPIEAGACTRAGRSPERFSTAHEGCGPIDQRHRIFESSGLMLW